MLSLGLSLGHERRWRHCIAGRGDRGVVVLENTPLDHDIGV